MRKTPWALYLWPGLPQLWLHGSWVGLLVALVSVAILDLLLLGGLGWSELIAPDIRSAVWAAGGGVWLIAVGCSAVWCGRWRATAGSRPGNDVFGEAVNHYLRGDYFQAELSLQGLLRANIRDLDARLLLATLLRHTGRTEEAINQLDTLVRFDGAAKWEVEIEHERELLAEAKAAKARVVESSGPSEGEQLGKVAHAA